jgi:hypothetical protein
MKQKAVECGSSVEHLPSMCEALGSILKTTKKKKGFVEKLQYLS